MEATGPSMAGSWSWTLSNAGSSTRVAPPMSGDQRPLSLSSESQQGADPLLQDVGAHSLLGERVTLSLSMSCAIQVVRKP